MPVHIASLACEITGVIGDCYPFMIPFALPAMICFLYVFYFITKNLLMVEGEGKIGQLEHAKLFLLIWMFPIGIWFIQPRVNKMFEA